jgi:hypothetical protein
VHDWSFEIDEAVHDLMPGSGHPLRVSGTCTFPTRGYDAELRTHEPKRRDSELLLDLVVREPSGSVPEVITEIPLAFEEQTDEDYRTVSVLPDGPHSFPIQILH